MKQEHEDDTWKNYNLKSIVKCFFTKPIYFKLILLASTHFTTARKIDKAKHVTITLASAEIHYLKTCQVRRKIKYNRLIEQGLLKIKTRSSKQASLVFTRKRSFKQVPKHIILVKRSQVNFKLNSLRNRARLVEKQVTTQLGQIKCRHYTLFSLLNELEQAKIDNWVSYAAHRDKIYFRETSDQIKPESNNLTTPPLPSSPPPSPSRTPPPTRSAAASAPPHPPRPPPDRHSPSSSSFRKSRKAALLQIVVASFLFLSL